MEICFEGPSAYFIFDWKVFGERFIYFSTEWNRFIFSSILSYLPMVLPSIATKEYRASLGILKTYQ